MSDETTPHDIAQLLFNLRERLPMFIITDHPEDMPDVFAARLHLSLPEAAPTNLVVSHPDLEALRNLMMQLGLTNIGREEGDQPVIVECWL